MNGTVAVLIGNLVAGLGMLVLFISTRMRDKRKILGIQSFNHGCSIVAGLLLQGYSGVVQDVVSLGRNVMVLTGRLTRFWKVFYVVAGLVLGLVFNNRGLAGLLPILASTEYALVVVNEHATERTLKLAIVVSTLCWALYSLFLYNFINLAANLLTCGSALHYLWQTRGGGSSPAEK